jgi:2-methylcitrate dehydratase PrpD
VDAQFNIPFAVALVLSTGAAPLAAFYRPLVVERELHGLFETVRIKAQDRRPEAAIVEIEYADGRRARAEVAIPRGHPSRPLGAQAIATKFHDCNRFAGEPLSSAGVDEVVATALGLPAWSRPLP